MFINENKMFNFSINKLRTVTEIWITKRAAMMHILRSYMGSWNLQIVFKTIVERILRVYLGYDVKRILKSRHFKDHLEYVDFTM